MKIVCVLKSGGDYHPRHVYALRDMCQQWLPAHEFVCLTDFQGLDCCTVALKHNLTGWWSKMELFEAFTEGETLYMDLDTIVRGDCLEIVTALAGRSFVILRDFYRGATDSAAMGSGVMFWRGSYRWLFEQFQSAGPAGLRGDQDFLESAFRQKGGKAEYWQDVTPGGIVSFKSHIQGQTVPSNAPIVAFHGQPRPWDQDEIPYPCAKKATLVQIDQPCVIVGNGPGVLRSQMGAIIDAFPQVVRINAYKTSGFEAHVGRKTTLHATHGKAGGFGQEKRMGRVLWLHEHASSPVAESWLVPKSFFWSLVQDWSKDRSILASSGLVTVAWLLEQGMPCLHLAGFDHFAKKTSHLHHYWNPTAMRKPKEHDGDREAAKFAEWQEQGRVRYL